MLGSAGLPPAHPRDKSRRYVYFFGRTTLPEEICRNHPDRPAVARCQKYNYGFCHQCLEDEPQCPDPDIYCKFRPQCIVYFELKENRRNHRQQEEN